ncbi:siderophore-interacting protein [Aquihabitans sp. G128]|nr:siderophore-interacting protein [Aquihabitans sp. G128]
MQCFVHGELGMVRELKPFLAQERQVPRELLSVSGYWRRGKDEDGFQVEKRNDPRD